MNNEEKILEMLTQMQEDISGMKSDISALKSAQAQTQDDLHRVKAYLELDVEKRFDAVNEGIDAILEKIVPEDRMEKAEDDIIVLKTAVRALARDVAELKKAQ